MVSQSFDTSSPYVRTEASLDPRVAFIIKGIKDEVIGDFGLSSGGAAGIEIDAANIDLGPPPHALVVALSQQHSDTYLMTSEDMLDPAPGLGGAEAEIIRVDIVFFETPARGAVFSVGSVAWAGSMAWNGYDTTQWRTLLAMFFADSSTRDCSDNCDPVPGKMLIITLTPTTTQESVRE